MWTDGSSATVGASHSRRAIRAVSGARAGGTAVGGTTIGTLRVAGAPWAARRGGAIGTLRLTGAPRTSSGGATARTGHSSPAEYLQWSGEDNQSSEPDPNEAVHCGAPVCCSLRAVPKSTFLAPFGGVKTKSAIWSSTPFSFASAGWSWPGTRIPWRAASCLSALQQRVRLH
jgi:hypothetical protein